MPVITLLHAKWARGARGHFIAKALVYLLGLISFTLLCQHARHGVTADSALVIKPDLMTPRLCSPSFFLPVTLPNGTVVLQQGQGRFNCDATAESNGSQTNVESWVLELATLFFALIFSLVEYRDLKLFVTELLGRERLREEQMHAAARPPLLSAMPGEVRSQGALLRYHRSAGYVFQGKMFVEIDLICHIYAGVGFCRRCFVTIGIARCL